MAVPFGFSIGDFIAGINLILTSINAVRDGNGSCAQFQAVASELESLKSGLSAINDLGLEQTAYQEHSALQEAAGSCQSCIEDFVEKVAKYQKWLQPGREGWKASVRKIQWAFCKKKDVVEFRQRLGQYSSSISILMSSLLFRQGLQQKTQQEKYQEAINLSHATTTDIQGHILHHRDMFDGLSVQQQSIFKQLIDQNMQLTNCSHQLVEGLRSLAEDNKILFRELSQVRRMLQVQQEVPAQVLLQKPVLLLDACGRLASFHLDFIDSKEAFLAVLKVRFLNCGVTFAGIEKVERSEFVLSDWQREISLDRPWQTVFKPGQSASMRMIVRCPSKAHTCPRCNFGNGSTQDRDIEW